MILFSALPLRFPIFPISRTNQIQHANYVCAHKCWNESFKDTLKKLKLTIIPESRNKGSKIPPTNLPISTLLFFNFTQFNSRTSNLFLKTIQSRVLHFSWKSWKPISQNWLKDQSKWKKIETWWLGVQKEPKNKLDWGSFVQVSSFQTQVSLNNYQTELKVAELEWKYYVRWLLDLGVMWVAACCVLKYWILCVGHCSNIVCAKRFLCFVKMCDEVVNI